MKFFAKFTVGLTLISSITAIPALADTGLLSRGGLSGLQVRGECPSVETIQDWLRKNTKVGDKTVFYTNPVSSQMALNYANAIGPEQDKLTARMAQALAKESKGEAFIMMQKGKAIPPNYIWLKDEYPNLKGRVKVTAVNYLDVNDKKPD
ncbi:hypothetical protein F5X99DRAFT_411862 [Biscogniauxia marginata]|nr:hypothetical protein F5X99DRAFT_411862 [Biscogniauxia marginata]